MNRVKSLIIVLPIFILGCARSENDKKFGTPCDNLKVYGARIETLQFKIDSIQNGSQYLSNNSKSNLDIEVLQKEKRSLQAANDKNMNECKPELKNRNLKEENQR